MDSPDLKDIHLPEALGWWPPAPGWWLLTATLALLFLLAYRLYIRLRRKTAIKQAHTLLKQMRQHHSDTRQTLTELSALLRRTAISNGDRKVVAALSGTAWLAYLDRNLPDSPFSQGIGHCLADAHFRPTPPDIDIEAVFALCERWLKQQGKPT